MGNSLVQNDTALDQAIEAIARDLACSLREHLDNPETVSGLRVALKPVFRSYIGTGFLSFGASLSFALSHALRDALEGHGQPDPTVTKNVQEFPEFAVLARTLGSTGGVFRTYANRLGGGRSSHASSIPKDALRCLDHYPTWHAELDARMDELMLAAQRPHTPVDLSRAEYDASYQEAADEAEVNRATQTFAKSVEGYFDECKRNLGRWRSRMTSPAIRFAPEMRAEIRDRLKPLFLTTVDRMVGSALENGATLGQRGQDYRFEIDGRPVFAVWSEWEPSADAKRSMRRALWDTKAKSRLEVVVSDVINHIEGVLDNAKDAMIIHFRNQFRMYLIMPTASSYIQRRFAVLYQERELVKALEKRHTAITANAEARRTSDSLAKPHRVDASTTSLAA